MGKLYNLPTLILRSCGNGVAYHGLPKDIAKLGNLRMFSLEFCSSLHNGKFQLEDLGKLNNLRNLIMYKLEKSGRTGGPMLNMNRNFYSLVLYFNPLGEDAETEHNSTLEALQPHRNLQHLHVQCYMGHGGPSWLITLTNLRSLSLKFCKEPNILHALGKLQSLETLELYVLRGIHKVGPEFLGAEIVNNMSAARMTNNTGQDDDGGATTVNLFPKLKRILFNFPWCFEWAGIPGWSRLDFHVRIMSRLEYLKLQGCYYLDALPDFLQTTPLKHLIIEDCPKLDEHCRDRSGKEWTKIQRVPDIQFV